MANVILLYRQEGGYAKPSTYKSVIVCQTGLVKRNAANVWSNILYIVTIHYINITEIRQYLPTLRIYTEMISFKMFKIYQFIIFKIGV